MYGKRGYFYTKLDRESDEDISHYMDIKSVESLEEACKEAIEDIQNIRKLLYEQVQKIHNISITKTVQVDRRKTYKNSIEIAVYINELKEIEGHSYNYRIYDTHKKFKGNEKKQALAYAEELKKQHNINQIIKNNWK